MMTIVLKLKEDHRLRNTWFGVDRCAVRDGKWVMDLGLDSGGVREEEEGFGEITAG